jgi:hypothetical protein
VRADPPSLIRAGRRAYSTTTPPHWGHDQSQRRATQLEATSAQEPHAYSSELQMLPQSTQMYSVSAASCIMTKVSSNSIRIAMTGIHVVLIVLHACRLRAPVESNQ